MWQRPTLEPMHTKAQRKLKHASLQMENSKLLVQPVAQYYPYPIGLDHFPSNYEDNNWTNTQKVKQEQSKRSLFLMNYRSETPCSNQLDIGWL